MSRNPKIERILSLWFDSDHCPPSFRAENRKKRDGVILEYVGNSGQSGDCGGSERKQMKLSNVRLGVVIALLGLLIIWDIFGQIRTGKGVNFGTFLLAFMLIILCSILFTKKKPN